jgi:Ca-activated chloride channel homolog
MSFGTPLLLLFLVIVPAVLGLAVWFDRRRTRYAVAFTNLDVLASVVAQNRRPWRRWIPLALFLLALAAASTALARPRITLSVPSNQATVVLLVDVSGSMRSSDVKPTRLGAAQHAMDVFSGKVPKNVRIGLVSFSTGPDVLVLPTTDRDVLAEGIDLLSPESGTAIGDGIQAAVDVLKSAVGDSPRGKDGKLPGAIVLLSDGAQTRGVLTPMQGAALARNAGVRIFTVVLGTNHGTLGFGGGFGGFGFGGGFGGGRGSIAVRPDPVTLAAIARVTGGTTFRATTAEKIDAIYKQLGQSIAHHDTIREVSSWFSGLAALLLIGSLGFARLTGERLP